MVSFIKRHWFGLLFIAALLARLPQLTAPLWYDESWTQWISGLPFDRMVAAVAGDVHPPLFFLLTWFMGRFALAPLILRLVPLAFSLLALLGGKRLAEELQLPDAAQVVAMLLMALSPWQLYYAAELRMYSMLEFWTVATLVMIYRRNWTMMGLCLAGLLYTHNYGFIFGLVLGLLALWRSRQAMVRPAVSGLLALVAYAPWGLIGLRSQMTAVGAGYWVAPPQIPDVLLTFYQWLFGNVEGGLEVIGMALSVWLLLTVLRCGDAELQWLTFAPVVVALAPSLWRPIYLPRALLPCAVPFYLMVGQYLAGMRLPGRTVAAGFLVPALALASATDAGRTLMVDRYHIASVAQFLERAQPGDAIYHLGLSSMVELHQYALPERQYLWDYPMSVQSGSYSLTTRQALGIDERPLADVPAAHIWLVVPINGYGDNRSELKPSLADLLAAYPSQRVLAIQSKYEYGVEIYEIKTNR